jgi:hypothetical protein
MRGTGIQIIGSDKNSTNMRRICEITADKLTKNFNEFIVSKVIIFVDKQLFYSTVESTVLPCI